jgi:hypothetical protein
MTMEQTAEPVVEAPPEQPVSPTIDDVVADAPPIQPAADPITPESVQSDKAPDDSLPDSSLIADRLQGMRDRTGAIDQRRAQEQDYTKLKEEVRLLRTLRGEGVGAQIDETMERVEARDDDQSTLMKELKKELQSMRAGQERMKGELEQREHQSQMAEAQTEVVTWVKDQKEHFPLLNEIGQQGLVYQKMVNEQHRTGQYISEAQAGREVESEIRAIVERCAPVMGYTRSEVEQRREEQVSVGSGHVSMVDPLDMDGMSDDEAIEAIVTDYEDNQR